jgi:squalene-hopene cyclase-like protein/prenyltransferase/squalene oxidase-like repeat protein
VSWQLASFSILSLALAAGFAWYERAHPSARVLALVATMAALAALGRIAFAPLPNVKPTTDIVLISGVALGGAPGFAVGALAALASNLFFGQGPWTPWQMVAWGGIGIGGAVLGRLAGDRLGRVTLATACALAGLAFGAVMNLSTWVTYTGDHSLAAYGTISATALPFDVAHATANLLFALAFGPALLRALRRFRRRFEVTWRPAPAVSAALLLALLVAAPAAAATPASYLLSAQNDDGGWPGGRGQPSAQLYTGWASLGMAATGRNPLDVRRGGRSPVDFMRANAGQLDDTGELERTILVLAAAGANPRRFAGRDLVAALERRRRPDGSYAGGTVLTAFSVLALKAAGRGDTAGVRRSLDWIARRQNADGGFSVAGRGVQSVVDDTAATVEALAAGGRRSGHAVRRAVAFLRRTQNPDGGFPLPPGDASNAQSTAFAVQAFVAAGANPDRVRRGGSRSPLAYLRSLTQPNGLVRYSRISSQTPVWVTAQVAMALARKPLPLARVPRRGAPAKAAAAGGAPPAEREEARSTAPASASSPALLRIARAAGVACGWLMAPLT